MRTGPRSCSPAVRPCSCQLLLPPPIGSASAGSPLPRAVRAPSSHCHPPVRLPVPWPHHHTPRHPTSARPSTPPPPHSPLPAAPPPPSSSHFPPPWTHLGRILGVGKHPQRGICCRQCGRLVSAGDGHLPVPLGGGDRRHLLSDGCGRRRSLGDGHVACRGRRGAGEEGGVARVPAACRPISRGAAGGAQRMPCTCCR